MKIKKNLSDEEMLKGFTEKDSAASFETKMLSTQPVKHAKEEKPHLISLPPEVAEKIDKEVMNIRLSLKNKGVTEVKWQVVAKDDEIIIKPTKKGK